MAVRVCGPPWRCMRCARRCSARRRSGAVGSAIGAMGARIHEQAPAVEARGMYTPPRPCVDASRAPARAHGDVLSDAAAHSASAPAGGGAVGGGS